MPANLHSLLSTDCAFVCTFVLRSLPVVSKRVFKAVLVETQRAGVNKPYRLALRLSWDVQPAVS